MLSFCAVRRLFCATPWTKRGGCDAAPRCVRRAKYATVTQEGQELEELLRRASEVSERQFFDSYQAVLAKGRDGPVLGLRNWLRELDLEDYTHQAMMWAEEMGACDLDEVLENLEDFSEHLGLERAEFLERAAAASAASAAGPAGASRPMNGTEREDLLHFWSLHWRRPQTFAAFDRRAAVTAAPLQREEAEPVSEPLSGQLFAEMRARQEGDLQYLMVMRHQAEWNLPELPSLDGNKTWTFCGGAEEWLQVSGADTTAPVPLAPLPRPRRRAMEAAVLGGGRRGARFLQTYVALERLHPSDLRGEFPVDAVNRSKQLCFQVARDLHGAGGLPDWNRSWEDAPVPLGITAESLENKSEVVQGLRRYYEVMDNTRIGQADKYFGHVLFGLLLSRLWKRFDLLRGSNLLSLEDLASQRALLEAQLDGEEWLEERLFEAFVTRSLEGGRWLSLTAAASLALRRHTDFVFGAGLREEIFVPLSRAAREGFRQGLRAVGPGLCADVLLKAAQKQQLRMLSLSDGSRERLMWHGLVFGSLLGQHELCSDAVSPKDTLW